VDALRDASRIINILKYLCAEQGSSVVREIDSVTLQSRLAAGDAVHLVDIRAPGEIAGGVIPNAEYLPMHLIPLRMGELPRDKDVILYCRSGARSYHACSYLMGQGFDNVVNLHGGIIGWARGGFSVTSPADTPKMTP
jgi:rhodanese-related sulfurtransferase